MLLDSQDYKTNIISVKGQFISEFRYSYNVGSTKYYEARIMVQRISGINDFFQVVTDSRGVCSDIRGKYVEIEGTIRSLTKVDESETKRLNVFIFANYIKVFEPKELENFEFNNYISISGEVVHTPRFKITISGKVICEMLIGVKTSFGKKDYLIPCITWNRIAEMSKLLEVGDKVEIKGRLQSRVYNKNGKEHEVYEVSCYYLSPIFDE